MRKILIYVKKKLKFLGKFGMNFEDAVIKVLGRLEYGITSRDKLKKIKIGRKNKFDRVMGYLESKKLIYPRSYENHDYAMSPEGVDFLNTKRKEKLQQESNRIIALTGSVVALVMIYNFLTQTNLVKDFNFISIIFLILLLSSFGLIIAFIINSIFRRN